MNFHLANGIYFRRVDDTIRIVRANDFNDPGEVIVETDLNGLASIVASVSPHQEQNGSFDYIYKFLKDGVMYCGGCGVELRPNGPVPIAGCLSIINRVVCVACGRLYSGDARDGVCRCRHSYGDHHLLLAIEESRRAATDEEFVPAECLDPNCDCQQYVDRRDA